ncbi:MAG: PilZ domain-containing protein [Candidatus Sphingomonas phytovorans]|nr:PilZ domain-containing protein [Sphingomonas sp.]WEJ99707.1 MAG: PilZ domain-containing protein [Sphingomonas sp.]
MALIARVYRSDPEERRGAPRYPVLVDATLRASDDGLPLDVLIYDLSMTGFRMETSDALDAEAMIWIGIAGTRVNAAVVARRGPNGYGCEFVTPITFYQLSEALNPAPVVVPLIRPEGTVVRPKWGRVLLASLTIGAFILCVVSLWPV